MMILMIMMILSGCNNSSKAADETFEEKYEAAKQKYDKYYQKIVSGQEVLDLIDNWDETDFGLAVDGVKNGMFEVNDVDKNDPNAVFTYWDKESGWYIDPNAYYRASFLLYQDPRKESDRGISDLYFHLVEDPSLSDDNTINPNNEQKNTDIGSVEIFTEDEELNELIKESVTISSNEKIEKAEWIEDNVCYRISVERKFDVEGEYGHIRDYIMVKDESFKCVEITYPSKNDSVNSDRYVYDACNFEINYIDVTFDGNKDIVISLGHQGAAGTCISCAYIYEDGEYKYVKSFENIPNYSLNNEEQFINGCFKDTEYKYIYTNGQFVELNDAIKKVHLDISAWIDSDDEWIYEKSANIEIYNNAEIEFVRWVDEDKTCLQIGIAYKEKPKAHYYKHKEDYFIFKGEIETLQVRYAYWYLEGMDRWVFANPTFESHFEDINFDGVDELIIQRGINGNSEMIMFSAYEYKDGEYVFFPAFEWIYSYTVNTENNTIECVRYSGDAEHIKYVTVYQYVDGKYIISDEYVE